MKKATKNKRKLARRIAAWNNLVPEAVVGLNTKMIRHDTSRSAHHKPGSQNGRR